MLLPSSLDITGSCIWYKEHLGNKQKIAVKNNLHSEQLGAAEKKANLQCTSIETCGWKLLPGGALYTTSFSDVKDKLPQ